ncbi:lactadherin-like isoform X1 [Acropora millepora]|uniref:lactadherin-like isoform X1 n=2 Tax=Acropora millepora TaxID=45264 RepID=UPI001CF1F33D|nr:lactadherin-like isoform X1 [Acropora millepora]
MWPICLCALFSLCLSLSVQSGSGLNISTKCTAAVGLEHLMIEDSKLSQSRGSGKAHPSCARLNNQQCAWCPPSGNGHFLQVDLGRGFHITAIATQGFLTTKDYYVKKYKVSYSKDGKTWSLFPEVMIGNHDGISVEKHNFSSPINAQFIRVHPIAHKGKICLRMELYGCSNPLTTTTAPTTQSAPNKTTPENVPSTTTTTASTSTEKLMINHSATAQSALRTKLLSTTLRVANDETPENVSPPTRATAASSTEKPMISLSATDQPVGSDKTIIIVIIVIIVVIIAVVIIWWRLWSCHRKRKRSERKSEEEVVELL